MPKTAVSATDRAVGTRLRVLRNRAGISQTVLGKKLGITFQQIQKYEKGTNRVPIGRLGAMAKALNVPMSALLPETADAMPRIEEFEMLAAPGALDLLRAYAAMSDSGLRNKFVALAEHVATNRKR